MSEVPVLPGVTRLWRFPLANLPWSTLPDNMPAPSIVENNWFITDKSPPSWIKIQEKTPWLHERVELVRL
jgi:uncharacterized protein (DUF2132 family)